MKEIEVVYKDPDFLVINKPAGIKVHGIDKRERGTLVDWLLENYPEVKNVGDNSEIRPGIVHRLDKDTSGLMIIVRTQKAFAFFKKQFQERKITKTYQAVVYDLKYEACNLKRGEWNIINKPIGLKDGTTKRTVHIRNVKMVKDAVTRWRVIGGGLLEEGKLLLEVQPITGRTHQIRVHLASIGYPIVGDRIYGLKKDKKDTLMLRAVALEFTDLDGKRLKIEGEINESFNNM